MADAIDYGAHAPDTNTAIDYGAHAVANDDGGAGAATQSDLTSRDWIDSTFNAVKHWWDSVNPLDSVKAAANIAAHPIDALKAYGDQNSGILKNAHDAFRNGDYAQGVRHVLGYIANGVPGLGEQLEKAGNEGQAGDVSSMVGDTLGLATNLFGPKILRELSTKAKAISLAPGTDPSTTRQSAAAFADREGIPISTGTRTGSAVARNLEESTRNAPGGAGVAARADAATRAALEKTGAELARQTGPQATAESAGAGVRERLADLSAEHGAGASSAYSRLEEIENNPDNAQDVVIGHEISPKAKQTVEDISKTLASTNYASLMPEQKATVDKLASSLGIDSTPQPVTKKMAVPVDMTAAKTRLGPILERLEQEMPLAQQQSSRGLLAIRNVVNGEDFVPASVADQNLSALKQLQREAIHPKTKFLANQAVNAVAPLVDKAVAGVGPEATEALEEGRALTKAKFSTDATLDQLPTEPVQLFNKLTSKKDAGINLLRDVQSKAPDAIPTLARAQIEGLLEAATNREQGMPGPARALSDWNKLGPSTKAVLFPDAKLRADLDDFFNLASRVADNPNPSGTAKMSGARYVIEHPVLGIPYVISNHAMAKILFTPGGARALNRTLTIPGTASAATTAALNVLKMAGSGATPMKKTADEQTPVPTLAGTVPTEVR